jgi:hypothetical protein
MKGWRHLTIDSERVQYYSVTVGDMELMLWQNTETAQCTGRITRRGRCYDGIQLGVGIVTGRNALIEAAKLMLQAEIHELETLILFVSNLTTPQM